jgi:integral membrane protein
MGMIHGILFPLYLIALVHLAVVNRWKAARWFMGVAAGLLPFGTFVFESYLKKRDWK